MYPHARTHHAKPATAGLKIRFCLTQKHTGPSASRCRDIQDAKHLYTSTNRMPHSSPALMSRSSTSVIHSSPRCCLFLRFPTPSRKIVSPLLANSPHVLCDQFPLLDHLIALLMHFLHVFIVLAFKRLKLLSCYHQLSLVLLLKHLQLSIVPRLHFNVNFPYSRTA